MGSGNVEGLQRLRGFGPKLPVVFLRLLRVVAYDSHKYQFAAGLEVKCLMPDLEGLSSEAVGSDGSRGTGHLQRHCRACDGLLYRVAPRSYRKHATLTSI